MKTATDQPEKPLTVSELIDKLQALDPNLPCVAWVDGYDNRCDFAVLGGAICTITLDRDVAALPPGTHDVLFFGPEDALSRIVDT